MSLRTRVKDWLVGAPEPEKPKAHGASRASRHERREAGRQRHHETGEPAWEAGDKVGQGSGSARDPDAAPEILGGS